MNQCLSLEELLKNNHDFKKLNPSLDNIRRALACFDNPHADYPSIIVAGTNGKGSVCTFLEQLSLTYTNLKVGKFTSPHLVSVTERIKIQGKEIDENVLASILFEIQEKLDFELTYFEKLSLAAYLYFSREKVDLAIIEVGMGGRWDCANVIPDERRLATVITSIGLDHMQFLGDTVEKIRIEKEAIKRDLVPHFDYMDFDFVGSTQDRNYQLALEVFKSCVAKKTFDLDEGLILRSFKASYRARFEYNEELNILIDAAHNVEAAEELAIHLDLNFKDSKKELHMAFLDKDYRSFVKVLTSDIEFEKIFIYQLNSQRASEQTKVINDLKEDNPSLNIQIGSLSEIKKRDTLKVYCGSIYFCGEVLKITSQSSQDKRYKP